MATIVNNPPARSNTSGALIAVILLLIIAVLFVDYGLPAIRSYSTPQVNVPGKIDVNVNTPQK
jgi:hypothetical protein